MALIQSFTVSFGSFARLLVFLLCAVWSPSAFALSVHDLQTEHLRRPVGLDHPRPRLSWTLASDERAQRQSGYQVLVASTPARLAADEGDVWDSGRVASADTFGIEVAARELESGRRYYWKVRVWDGAGRPSSWSEPEWWQMGLLRPDDWQASWIGPARPDAGSPLLRREFEVDRPVIQATAYAYGFGWYELHLNGGKVGDRVLTPINSNYQKGLFYDAYDVTGHIRSGRNAVGLWLGSGYDEGYSKYGYRWMEPKAGLVQLELRFADGTRRTIVTDESWTSADSPILANHIYHGETYDARRERRGWSEPGYDARDWQPVVTRDVRAGPLKASLMPPLKVMHELRPVSMTEVSPGVYVFDLGQNIAGWVRLQVQGRAGDRVVLRHAEAVYGDGRLDVTTNRAAEATDTYILRGGGVETYEPRFTYHGFRYVEVTGYPGRPTLDSLVGRAVHAAVEDVGTFVSSDPLLNRIHENFRWSIRNNLMGIPTDTAVRDERTPCAMDSLAVEEAAIYNFDLLQYYTKWLQDIRGDLGMPPNWTGDQVVLPELLYWHYGDRRILEQHFENMKRVTDAFASEAEAKDHWSDGFGDWAAPNEGGGYETSFSEGEIVNTAFFYRCARITADVAARMGATADAEHYGRLAEQIRREFHNRHFDPSKMTYGSGRQVTSILPLAFGMVPSDLREAVAAALHERVIGADRGHLDTGIFGTRYLFDVLIDHGYEDTAWCVLTRQSYPSYGYQIALGATTTWEQWSYRGGMQSHNHAMFSGPGATFYSHLGGIRPAAPGYREIVIRPSQPEGLVQVEASTRTIAGTIRSIWRRHEGYSHRVVLPVNTTATVYVPANDAAEVEESGRPVAEAPGVRFLRMEGGHAVFAVESGNYVFTVRPSSS